MSIEYVPHHEPFAERHFVSSFSKKYKSAWDVTWKGLLDEFKNFDVLIAKSNATTIVHSERVKVFKVDFRVHGTEKSRRGSGNRYIVACTQTCDLFLYTARPMRSRETDWWKGLR